MARFKVGGRNSSTPRLKRRFQFLVVGTIIFMVAISFFILKPEISGTGQDSSISASLGNQLEVAGDVVVNRVGLPPDVTKLTNGEAVAGVPVQKVVETLVQKYHVEFGRELEPGRSPWEVAAGWVTPYQVLPESTPDLGAVLHAMATAPIIAVDNGFRGTQLKLSMKLAGDQIVAFKPKWYERDYIIEGSPVSGRDRHNGEIAAFHLSRILGFRRTPLAVGRKVSFSRDIVPVASKDLLETFHETNGETCFYGRCHYCSKDNSLCTKGDILEGSVVLWLPPTVHLKAGRNPWRRTYREKLLAKWEKDDDYCNIVRQIQPFKNDSALLLDLIDTIVFDYLIGNGDRHHYEVMDGVSDGMLVMLDNGKSFGNPYQDERSILAPLYQCCSIRYSTWQKLLSLQNNVLGSILREVLRSDPIHPVLTPQHFRAIDRRLEKVLQEVEKCIKVKGLNSVILEAKAKDSEDDNW
ncbi:glycosaminoglycan xylosylkinase-like isoform X2 [Littorina saxatilis]|uniref:FAM20 C-terminal domain-containing protein n=1 Tax=Littorina saxatilis TaxID=31220 RepID=A0AAN9AWS5_9CAEN